MNRGQLPVTSELRIPKPDLLELITTQIVRGQAFLERPISSREEYVQLDHDKERWRAFTLEVLKRGFYSGEIAWEFESTPIVVGMSLRWDEWVSESRASIRRQLNKLESVKERLDLYPEYTGAKDDSQLRAEASKTKVFLVHGRDESSRHAMARFLSKLGLTPIILAEQVNQGLTLIEKIEEYGDVGFAVVLLTPDDEGHLVGHSEDRKLRARQNVILELGYFMARLGRNRVAAVLSPDVEIPSDIFGVLYIELDKHEGWKLRVARELRAAGMAVDMNLVE